MGRHNDYYTEDDCYWDNFETKNNFSYSTGRYSRKQLTDDVYDRIDDELQRRASAHWE